MVPHHCTVGHMTGSNIYLYVPSAFTAFSEISALSKFKYRYSRGPMVMLLMVIRGKKKVSTPLTLLYGSQLHVILWECCKSKGKGTVSCTNIFYCML